MGWGRGGGGGDKNFGVRRAVKMWNRAGLGGEVCGVGAWLGGVEGEVCAVETGGQGWT